MGKKRRFLRATGEEIFPVMRFRPTPEQSVDEPCPMSEGMSSDPDGFLWYKEFPLVRGIDPERIQPGDEYAIIMDGFPVLLRHLYGQRRGDRFTLDSRYLGPSWTGGPVTLPVITQQITTLEGYSPAGAMTTMEA